jgi:hypothetical protein
MGVQGDATNQHLDFPEIWQSLRLNFLDLVTRLLGTGEHVQPVANTKLVNP